MLIFFPRPLSQCGIATKCCNPTCPAQPAAASWWLPLLLTHKPRRGRKGEWKVNLPQLFNDRFSSLRQSQGLWSQYFQAALQGDRPPSEREAWPKPGSPQDPAVHSGHLQLLGNGSVLLLRSGRCPQVSAAFGSQAVVRSTVVTSAGLTDVWISEIQPVWYGGGLPLVTDGALGQQVASKLHVSTRVGNLTAQLPPEEMNFYKPKLLLLNVGSIEPCAAPPCGSIFSVKGRKTNYVDFMG